jgi:hypothetical protein
MSRFASRLERLELKYLVDEKVAAAVRADLDLFCRGDPHNAGQDAGHRDGSSTLTGASPAARGYRVSSLYLDSPALAFHEAKERGDAERLKLRVRTYSRESPAVLELKRRVCDVIDKTRAAVDRKDVERAARGLAGSENLGRVERGFLDRFAHAVAESGAQPHIQYEREAYVSLVDHYARVTFDRQIQARRAKGWDLDPGDRGWCAFDDSWSHEPSGCVILELKCQSLVPMWVLDLVRRHRLKRQSFSKYSVGIHLTGLAAGEDRKARRSARWVV